MKKLNFFIVLMLVTFYMSAQEIPQMISYQGKLLENGFPVNGFKDFVFTIDTWTEIHSNVEVNEGLYSVTLGENVPIPTNIFDNSTSLTLEIEVEGVILSPQTDILSVAYAYKAEKAVDAEEINGNPVSGNPSTNDVLKWNGSQWTPQEDNTNPTGSAGGDLHDNYPNPTVSGLQNNPISTTTPTDEQVLKYDGSQWTPENDGLMLPYDGIYGGSSPAFQITNNGNNDAFKIDNNGTSGALFVSNDINSDWGVYISNHSDEDALHISNSGTGRTLSATNSNIDYEGNPLAYFHILEPTNDGTVIYAATNGTGYAGKFTGNVDIIGNLSKSSGTFKIDHPLDPENKFLYHSFVESPDMMNVYNGNVVLDDNGVATIKLPKYFESLNMEFRYQLTCIGSFAQVYISKEIFNNEFEISGGTPGLKISWQVTGIRKDPYANQNRIRVEVEKTGKEKGQYLHYEEYGQTFEKSIKYVKSSRLKSERKEITKKEE